MTIKTLKTLIGFEFDRVDADSELINSVMRLIELYESEQLPDYTTPYVDPSTYFPASGKDIPCGVPDKVPYGTICPCNPANGGSGVCGCVMGNQMVDNPAKYGQTKTTVSNTSVYNSIHNFVEPDGGDKNFCKMCGINRNQHMTITLT